jgi:hypothetical protein
VIQNFLFDLFLALITTAVGILTPVIAAWLYQVSRRIHLELGPTRLALLQEFAQMVVDSAQHSGLLGVIENNPTAIETYAIAELQKIVDAHSYWHIDVAQVEAAIKAEILARFHDGTTAYALPPKSSAPTIAG